MKNVLLFISENFQFLEVKFSIYLNRHVLVHIRGAFRIHTVDSRYLDLAYLE